MFESYETMAVSKITFGVTVCVHVCDVMNLVSVCGKSMHYITGHLSLFALKQQRVNQHSCVLRS